MYCAGVAFSGATEFPVDLRSFDNKELSLILFEAVRGNNKELINTLSQNIPSPYLNRALIFGSVAAGNVRLLTVTLKNLVGNNNFMKKTIPVIESGNFLGCFDNSIPLLDHMIVFALYYHVHKKSGNTEMLEYLTE